MTSGPVETVIEFKDVSFAFGSRRVVDRVSLALRRGESLALVGRSGAGKSTLLRLANGLLMPSDGTVLVDGNATWSWDPIRLRRQTGYVLQGIGLFPHLTIEQNVALVPRLEGWSEARRRARAHELLALVGLSPAEYADRWPGELSGGQQQRVGVARAIAANPPVLLMDEPFGALDPATRRDLQRVFLRLRDELMQTSLFVTHDMREACLVGTRVGVLEGGALIACEPSVALARSADPRVRALFSDETDGGAHG